MQVDSAKSVCVNEDWRNQNTQQEYLEEENGNNFYMLDEGGKAKRKVRKSSLVQPLIYRKSCIYFFGFKTWWR